MKKQSQKEFVISILRKDGEITRNFCLKNYITRLASIIPVLRQMEDWDFYAHYREYIKLDGTKGKDFVYEVTRLPEVFHANLTKEAQISKAQSKIF